MPGLNRRSLRRRPEPARPRDRRKSRASRLRRPDRRTGRQEHPDWCRLVTPRRLETSRTVARRAAHHSATRLAPRPGDHATHRSPSRGEAEPKRQEYARSSQEEGPRCANTRGHVQPVTNTKPKDRRHCLSTTRSSHVPLTSTQAPLRGTPWQLESGHRRSS